MQTLNEHKVKPQCEFRVYDTGALNEHEAKPMCEFSAIGTFANMKLFEMVRSFFRDSSRSSTNACSFTLDSSFFILSPFRAAEQEKEILYL